MIQSLSAKFSKVVVVSKHNVLVLFISFVLIISRLQIRNQTALSPEGQPGKVAR